jgi:photosystem II stability/assembly factor-like uncharacterized protein
MKQITTLVLLLAVGATLCTAQSAWQYLPTAPTSSRIDDLYFTDQYKGWCCTSNGRIYRTPNGGATWSLIHQSATSNTYFRCIEFRNLLGFAGSLNGHLLRTTNGGATWTDMAPNINPTPDAICGLHIVDDQVTYAVGQWDSPAFLLKTTDGGLTWTHKNMGQYANALIDVRFISRDTGWVCGKSNAGATILYTTDGGDTWTQKFNSNIAGEYIWKLQLVTPEVWIGSLQTFAATGRMVKSTDGGQTWTAIPAPLPDMQGIGFVTPNHGWVGGYGNGLYETLDGGATWSLIQFGGNFNRIFVLDSTFAYASGSSIYKYFDPLTSVHTPPVAPISSALKWDFALLPNPASTDLKASFALDQTDRVRITLLAPDGRELNLMYHQRLPAGQHTVDLALPASVPAGNYLVGVQRNHGLMTKQLVVVR